MSDKEQAVAFVECAVIGNGLMLLVLGTAMEGWIVVPMGLFGFSLLCAWPYRDRLSPPDGNVVPDASVAPPPAKADGAEGRRRPEARGRSERGRTAPPAPGDPR